MAVSALLLLPREIAFSHFPFGCCCAGWSVPPRRGAGAATWRLCLSTQSHWPRSSLSPSGRGSASGEQQMRGKVQIKGRMWGATRQQLWGKMSNPNAPGYTGLKTGYFVCKIMACFIQTDLLGFHASKHFTRSFHKYFCFMSLALY